MNHFPPLWIEVSVRRRCLWRRLQSAPRSLLMLDYDGTLAPFQDDRFRGYPLPWSGGSACRAYPGWPGFVWCWSPAVPARELRDLLPYHRQEPKSGAATGGERLRCTTAPMNWPRLIRCSRTALRGGRAATVQLSGFAAALEMKPSSLAVHWRGLEPEARSGFAPLYLFRLRATLPRAGRAAPAALRWRSRGASRPTARRGLPWSKSWRRNRPRSRWPTWAMISPTKTPLPQSETGGFSILVRTEVRESVRPASGYARRQELLNFWPIPGFQSYITEPLEERDKLERRGLSHEIAEAGAGFQSHPHYVHHRGWKSLGDCPAAVDWSVHWSRCLKDHGGIWVGSGGTEDTPQIRKILEQASGDNPYKYAPLFLTEEEQSNFYEGFSNEIVWPLFHDLNRAATSTRGYWEFYERVNRKFADAVEKPRGILVLTRSGSTTTSSCRWARLCAAAAPALGWRSSCTSLSPPPTSSPNCRGVSRSSKTCWRTI